MKEFFILTEKKILLVFSLLVLFLFIYAITLSNKPSFTVHIAQPETWNFVDRQALNIKTFTDELLLEIAREENFEIKIYSIPSGYLLESLAKKHYLGIVYNLNPIFYKNVYLFSRPIFYLGPVILIRTKDDFYTFDDFDHKLIGVENGSYNNSLANLPGSIIIPYETTAGALADLEKEKIDGVIVDNLFANELIQGQYKEKFKVAIPLLSEDNLRIVTSISPENREFIVIFNKGLEKLQKNGRYNELLLRWNLPLNNQLYNSE